ncbi:MAG: GtrA family protein [Patescibacteria group bacterium]
MRFFKRSELARYLGAGVVGAFVHFTVLYLVTDAVGLWYLWSTTIAFVTAFLVSFNLQKHWTFNDKECSKVYQQASMFFIIASINLAVNAAGMYLLVDIFHQWYLFAQVVVTGTIALESFFLYKFVIFR